MTCRSRLCFVWGSLPLLMGLLLGGIVLGGLPVTAEAQGTLVIIDRPIPLPRPIPIPRPTPPTPQVSYALKELAVQAKVIDQVAQVQVSQTFQNTGASQIEVQFVFPLPYDGAIDSLTLMVDGKEYPAQLLSAKEARARYEAIVRSNKDPALLEYLGTGMFQTSVFPVPAGAERKISLTYQQLLRKDHGLTDFLFPLSTAKYTSKPVEKVDVQIQIESQQDIKNIYSPTHPIEIQRPDSKRAIVRWSRTQETPGADFRLFYDVAQEGLSARVLSYRPQDSEDGFFLLLASPPIKSPDAERPLKTVLFVVDKSGSMSGKKMEQTKSALKFVLNNLREGDLFNIVAYEGRVESFRPELQGYNDETRKAALGYVDGLYAGGGTNIHGALTAGLGQLQDSSRPNFVVFMTDGLPTVGNTKEGEIAAATKSANQVRARILPFGVGYDVNSRLLDRIARDNFGLSEFVRPEEDIEAAVSKVFSRIASPVMTNVAVTFEFDGVKPEDGPPINRRYPEEVHDLFEGQQLAMVGRYRRSGAGKVEIRGQVGSQAATFDFPAEFVAHSGDSSFRFIEKLWATRRIGELIDQLDLHGRNEELVKELVELSTKHGILTPYTSFLADETARPDALAGAAANRRAAESLRQLDRVDGRGGVAQRAEKAAFQNAAAPVVNSPFGGSSVREAESDQLVVTDAVRAAGSSALYARGSQYRNQAVKLLVTPETAELNLEQQKDQIQEIERYTDAYFTLVQANTPEENLLFVQQKADEQLLVKLRGQAYLIK